jgi:hypothetical protein
MDDHGAGQQSGGGGRSKRCRFLTLAVVLGLAPVALSFFLTLKTALGYDQNLLQNGGFEQGTSGWTASWGANLITVTDPVSSGNWAAAISGTTGSIWIYQDVVVVPGATYTLTGLIHKYERRFHQACLGIEWLESGSPDLQECLYDDHDFYLPLTVSIEAAPSYATRARIKARAYIRTANPANPIYFDELSLTSNMMPVAFIPLCLKNYPR